MVAVVVAPDVERDVGDAHHLAAVRVDDLLVEQVAHEPEHVLVVVVRRQLFVVEEEAVEADGAHLSWRTVSHAQPPPTR